MQYQAEIIKKLKSKLDESTIIAVMN